MLDISLDSLATYLAEEWHYRRARVAHRRLVGRPRRRPVLVNGAQRTGTVWVQRLLTAVPGYRKGDNFAGDLSRYARARDGDVIHGHEHHSSQLDDVLTRREIRTVLTIRDPRDEAVSLVYYIRRDPAHPFNRIMTGLSENDALTLVINGSPPLRESGQHPLPGIDQKVALTESWLTPTSPSIPVRYEDLLARPAGVLTGVLEQLDIVCRQDLIDAAVARASFGRASVGRKVWKRRREVGETDPVSHARQGAVGDWRRHFTDRHREQFKAVAGQALVRLGYEQDDTW